MLIELDIKNLAIIDSQKIHFGSGLNVISGETGAGKSIILEALQLILGGRANSDLIRTGEDSWQVQALFDIRYLTKDERSILPDFIEAEEQELIISRSLNNQGKSKIYVNGQIANLTILNNAVSNILNICSQGQQVQLLDPEFHLQLIDNYADLGSELLVYRKVYFELKELKVEIEKIEEQLNNSKQRTEELELIVKELSGVKLRAGLRDELQAKVNKFASAEKILLLSQDVNSILNSDNGIFSSFSALKSILTDLEKKDSNIKNISELFESSNINMSEFDQAFNSYLASFDLDEESLNSLREDLAEIARLERKYKLNDGDLVVLLQKSQQELNALNSPEDFKKLYDRQNDLEGKIKDLAEKLKSKRLTASKKLAKEVIQELKELNLKDVNFEVSFTDCEINQNGNTKIEFLISTNKGEPLKAIKKVASGGELSRIMLVLKKILNENSGVNVLVFDEVDSGVSGSVARAVGEKLKDLSKSSQVLCITHLPQVASLADHHFLVEKSNDKVRTTTSIKELTKSERIEEVARMLSGHNITNTSRETAKELLGV